MLRDERPVCSRRDRCVAVIGDNSPLIDGEPDALNSNATGCTKTLWMEFGKGKESS